MRRSRVTDLLLIALLVLSASSCAEIQALDEAPLGSVGEMSDRVRFCLSLARAVSAIESGSPGTARDAIEEAVAQAPDDLLGDVRSLADRLRAVEDQGADGLRDPDVRAAADELRERTRDLCDPT